MDQTMSEAEPLSRSAPSGWRRASLLGLAVLGVALATSSVSRLRARVDQLERQAAESEARVAELQVLRDGMARRLRQMEDQLKPPASPPTASRQPSKRPAPTH